MKFNIIDINIHPKTVFVDTEVDGLNHHDALMNYFKGQEGYEPDHEQDLIDDIDEHSHLHFNGLTYHTEDVMILVRKI